MLSRVADSLYWMSRLLERAENTARCLDVHLNTVLELSPAVGRKRYAEVMQALQIVRPEGQEPSPAELTLDSGISESISSCIGGARENARQIREQISSEMFEQLNRLYLYIRSRPTQDRFAIEPHSVFQKVKDGAHLFQGITDSTMTHGQGWHWIQAGRYLERADLITGALLHHLHDPLNEKLDADPQHFSELLALLKSLTGWEAYSKIYGAELTHRQVAEFLVLSREFPHSLHFTINMLSIALEELAQATGMTIRANLEAKVGKLLARLRYSTLDEFFAGPPGEALLSVRRELHSTHDRLYEIYLSHTFARV